MRENLTRKKTNLKLRLTVIVLVFIATFSCLHATIAHASPTEGLIQLSVYALYGSGSSSSSSNDGLGHAWIVVENGTRSSYSFYNTTLLSGETYSIGTWGNRKDPDTDNTVKKAWLNLESHFQMVGENTVSLTINISKEQLKTVSDKCIELNNWGAIKNCSYFASQVWNSVAPESKKVNSFFFPANFPKTLKASIQKIDGYQTNRKIDKNDYIGYCTDSDSFKQIDINDIAPLAIHDVGIMRSYDGVYSSFPTECYLNEINPIDC